jgi:hypothetical protein
VVEEEAKDNFRNTGGPSSDNRHTSHKNHPSFQAAEQAEALYFPAALHDLIIFTLELPLLECVQDEKGTIFDLQPKISNDLCYQSACAYSTA